MMTTYVGPMVAAIDESFGNSKMVFATYQKATQLQSAVMIAQFDKAVQDMLVEKKASGDLAKDEFLSQEDYEKVYTKAAKFGAVIEPIRDDAHHINLSRLEGERGTRDFSRNYSGEFGGKSTMQRPSKAGVSVSPLLTISRGDAAMIVNFFADKHFKTSGADRTLPVFDGLEMPADGIDTLSKLINKAVSEAWLTNPAMDLYESYADWLRQGQDGPLTGLVDEGKLAELDVMIFGEAGDFTPKNRRDAMIRMRDNLKTLALSIEARKRMFARVQFSLDHMASAEQPHNNDGELLPEDDDAMEARLQEIYAEELTKGKRYGAPLCGEA